MKTDVITDIADRSQPIISINVVCSNQGNFVNNFGQWMHELLQVVKLIIPRLSEINLNLTSGWANIYYETMRVPNSGDMCI